MVNCAAPNTGNVPINRQPNQLYQTYPMGLYVGTNTRPAALTTALTAANDSIIPRNSAGVSDPTDGKIVVLCIGSSFSFGIFERLRLILVPGDPSANSKLVLVNGAQSGALADVIVNPAAQFWTNVATALATAGVTANQVQVIWFMDSDTSPSTGFPTNMLNVQSEFLTIFGTMQTNYPFTKVCYLTPRVYAGYADIALNPEPYAYENGLSCQRAIASWLAAPTGAATMFVDWGPYWWADGRPIWICEDYGADGTHMSAIGQNKAADRLLLFWQTDPLAQRWYLK